MAGPREYAAGVRPALALLSRGTCYYPDCDTPSVVFIDDEPIVNYEIAHIRDAKQGNRYDPDMSDDERRSFSNLVLLCKPHHTLVDKTHPERFSVADLEKWKKDREGPGVEALRGLRGLTESRLADLITRATRTAMHRHTAMHESENSLLLRRLLGFGSVSDQASEFLNLAVREPGGHGLSTAVLGLGESVLARLRPAFDCIRWLIPPVIETKLNAAEVYLLHMTTACLLEDHLPATAPFDATATLSEVTPELVSAIRAGALMAPRYLSRGTPLHLDLIQAYAHLSTHVSALIDWIELHHELTLLGVGPRGQSLQCQVSSTSFQAELDLRARVGALEQLLKHYAFKLPPQYVTLSGQPLGETLALMAIAVDVQTLGYRSWPLRFDVAPRQVIEMVSGRAFYRRDDAPIRELLQNAVDACRHRAAMGNAPDYEPMVHIRLADSRDNIVVLDNGAGMSEAVIRDYLGKVGRSYYREHLDELRTLGFEPIGRFGIGLLAAFALARRLRITTWDGFGDAYRVEIPDAQSYFSVRIVTREEQGTDVALELSRPLEFDLLAACRYYARLVEVPITVVHRGVTTTIPPRAFAVAGWRALADDAARQQSYPLLLPKPWESVRDRFIAFSGRAVSAHAIAELEVVIPNPEDPAANWVFLPRPAKYIALCNRGILISQSATLGLRHPSGSTDDEMFWYGVYGSVDLTIQSPSLGPTREFLVADLEREVRSLVTAAVFDGLANILRHYGSGKELSLQASRRLTFDLLVAETGSGRPGSRQDMTNDDDVAPAGEYDLRYSTDRSFTALAAKLYSRHYPVAWFNGDGEVRFETLEERLRAASWSGSRPVIEVVRADPGFWHQDTRRRFRVPEGREVAVVDSTREVGLIESYCRIIAEDAPPVHFLRADECLRRCSVIVRPYPLVGLPEPQRWVVAEGLDDPSRAIIDIDHQLARSFVMFRGVHTVEPGSPLFAINARSPVGRYLILRGDRGVADFLSNLLDVRSDSVRMRHDLPTLKLLVLRLLSSGSRLAHLWWPTRAVAQSLSFAERYGSGPVWPTISSDGSIGANARGPTVEDRVLRAWWLPLVESVEP